MIKKLLCSDPELAKRKFSLSEIITEHENLKQTIVKYLKDLIFHNLAKVKPMYKSVLDIDFGDIEWLSKAVQIRHHCVHRAGYDKNGNKVDINQNDLDTLIQNCKDLAETINSSLNNT
ncbi:MAG: hypothetical protein L3J53_01000 [Proteobacteria bacterium]|nr:hypothetical protein [Pseudomonadota bacterium]